MSPYLKVKKYSNGKKLAPVPIGTGHKSADCCPGIEAAFGSDARVLPRFGVGAGMRRSRAVLCSSGDSATLVHYAGGELFKSYCYTYC